MAEIEVTRKEALSDMWGSKALFITKDGRYYSYDAADYVKQMHDKYAGYCKEEMRDSWDKEIYKIILCVPDAAIYDDFASFDHYLYLYECAGEIMKHIANGESWEDIKNNVISKQGYTNCDCTFEFVGQILLKYSPFGIEFVENVGPSKRERTYLIPTLNESLKKAKRETSKKDKCKRKNIYHNS